MADPNCPICNGTGFKIIERGGLTAGAKCECGQAQRVDRMWEEANIPLNYASATFDTFKIPDNNPLARDTLGQALREAKKYAREYPEVKPKGLLFLGDPGAGKTHLAIAVMKQLLDKGRECVFFDYQNLLDRIRAGYDATSGAADKEAYRAALDAPVLVLDDLGAHRVTEWVEDTVTSIITYRCNHSKPLIATTNLPDEDRIESITEGGYKRYKKTLSEMIGTRARSRLFEMCKVIRMPAVEDYRVKHAR